MPVAKSSRIKIDDRQETKKQKANVWKLNWAPRIIFFAILFYYNLVGTNPESNGIGKRDLAITL